MSRVRQVHHTIRDAPHLLTIVGHHQDRHLPLQGRKRLLEPACGPFVEATPRLIENQQLGQRIERIGQQHAPQLAARQGGQRAARESAQPYTIEQRGDALLCVGRNAETNGTALPGQREEISDRYRQRAIDLKLLRYVRDASAPRPVSDD